MAEDGIGPSTSVKIQIGYIVAILALCLAIGAGYAELKTHDHDDRYCPREVVDARLEALQETAQRIEKAVEELRNGEDR